MMLKRRTSPAAATLALLAPILSAVLLIGAAPQAADAHGPKGHGPAKEKLRFKKAPGQGGETGEEANGESKDIPSYGKPPMRLDTKVMYQRLDPRRDSAMEMARINNQSEPAYTISDCTEGEKAMVCCTFDGSDKGGDCGIFKMVCEEWGWTVEGDPKSAKCTAP